MYLQGKLTIDLTDTRIEMRPPRNFFGGLANLLTRGHWGTSEAMETYKLLAFVQSANRALRQLGVQNVIRVALGDDVIYEDRDDTPDDLATAMQTLQDKVAQGYEPDPHAEFDMLLKQDDGELLYVIDLDFVREHQVGVDPIVMRVTATPSPLRRRKEEDQDAYQQRISSYFETQDRFDQAVDAWEERLTSFLNQIADHFRANFGIAHLHIKMRKIWPDTSDTMERQTLTTFGSPLYGYDPVYDLAHIWLWDTLRRQHLFLNYPAYLYERERSGSNTGGGGAVDLGRDGRASDSGGGGWLSNIGDFFSDSGGGGSVDGGSSDSGGCSMKSKEPAPSCEGNAMTLLGMQTVLTRLYTDRAFREAFFADAVATCAHSALSEAERRQLAALDRRQVERYARSLHRKRLHLVRALLPATANTLSEQFAPLFLACCDMQPSALEHVEEAIAFTTFLSSAHLTAPAYIDDLLTCERLRLEVLYTLAGVSTQDGHITSDAHPQLTPHARVAAFQYDMATLYPLAAAGARIEARPDPSLVLIGKVREQLYVKWKRINATTAQLLRLCNGTRTVQAIIDAMITALRLDAGPPLSLPLSV